MARLLLLLVLDVAVAVAVPATNALHALSPLDPGVRTFVLLSEALKTSSLTEPDYVSRALEMTPHDAKLWAKLVLTNNKCARGVCANPVTHPLLVPTAIVAAPRRASQPCPRGATHVTALRDAAGVKDVLAPFGSHPVCRFVCACGRHGRLSMAEGGVTTGANVAQ